MSTYLEMKPDERRTYLSKLMEYGEQLQEDGTALTHDILSWTRAIHQFLRLAWNQREFITPKRLFIGEIEFPPFSEQVNPSNRDSVPSCFNRIVRDHFAFASNKAVEMLVDDFDFCVLFDAFFRELGVLCGTTVLYEAQSAFEEFFHRLKYYSACHWLWHPSQRLRDQINAKILAENFKSACKPLSLELFKLEQGVQRPWTGSADFEGETRLLGEHDFQGHYIYNPSLHERTAALAKKRPEVSRSVAARLCGVQYNTIKNWETKGPSSNAFDYPGRGSLKELREFSDRYCDRLHIDRISSKVLKAITQ